ncbi:hypothetical protein M758_2G172600 [Ceratodon purpureus]|nr:hypothetical protein M758_2G172600 [Ceratodon purpureus]
MAGKKGEAVRPVAFAIVTVLVLMLGWDPPLIGPLAGLNFDWSNWNTSDMRPFLGLEDWPCDPHNKLVHAHSISLQNATGPESLAFDGSGGGPYTGVADGRILRWDGNQGNWLTFGVTSSVRTEVCDMQPSSVDNEHVCGRPLGLRFDKHGNLYIADAYLGLLVMGPQGGVAKAVSTQAEGVPFKFVNDLDFDENGTVYFTDSSARRPRKQCNLVTFEQDKSGRLLKYDPQTQQTTVIARDLFYPNGIAVSQDSSFLLFSYTSKSRIMKFWLKGPKSGTMEEFAEVPGYPDNIRITKEGDFWVALHSRVTRLQYFFAKNWYLLRLLYSLPFKFDHIAALTTGPPDAMVVKFNPHGEAIEAFEDRSGLNASFLSYAEERDGLLWMSSVFLPKIWTLPLNASAGSSRRFGVI